MKKTLKWFFIVGLITLVGIQFIPADVNKQEVISSSDIRNVYDVPDNVMNILENSCYDCHSNNTNYPWYSLVQPIRLIMDHHIEEGKEELNFSEISADYNTTNFKFDINYLKDDKIGGEKEYFKSKLELKRGSNGLFAFSNKRNLITNASEYYDLSYEYINDCLRAGLVYRREFYNDSELEPENTLMFTITLNSFGALNSPGFN